jgi:hypothetical protein
MEQKTEEERKIHFQQTKENMEELLRTVHNQKMNDMLLYILKEYPCQAVTEAITAKEYLPKNIPSMELYRAYKKKALNFEYERNMKISNEKDMLNLNPFEYKKTKKNVKNNNENNLFQSFEKKQEDFDNWEKEMELKLTSL